MTALCILNGMGTSRDRTKGAAMLQEEASEGYAPAAVCLGDC